ncbi:hypothetical protein QE152_g24992 [Popillia japonica]|uniref:Ig-like domain-containing protein n=1 Tax=Popillia japonica TaxID=7064 RepID=A0AAW1K2G1_POPJA
MDRLRILTFVTICCSVVSSIKINDLVVPSQLQHGTANDVTLDCKYQIENKNDRNGLVVKWFFQQNNLIYQWFPGKVPEVTPLWKQNVDLNHKISNDPLTKYRALKIINISTDMSGEYTCKVSSYEDEASLTKMMVVYEPPKIFTFEHFENQSTLLCGAYNMFPRPIMEIYPINVNITNLDDNDNEDDDDNLKRYLTTNYINDVEEAHGWYNVTKSFRYYPEEIIGSVEFVCELTIPNTSWVRKLTAVVTLENSSVVRNVNAALLASALVVLTLYL